MDKIIKKPSFLLMLFFINLIGSVYGFYWYRQQVSETPGILKVFVPDSPTASLLFTLALLMIIIKKPKPFMTLVACGWLIKYGLWAVIINTHFLLMGGDYTFTNFHLTLSHLGMAAEGFLFLNKSEFNINHILTLTALMLISDIVEITVNTTSVDSGSGTPGKYEGEQEEEELIEDIDDKQTSNTINVTLNVAPQISGNTAISSILASDINNIIQEIQKMQSKEDRDYKIVVKVNAVSGKQVTKAEVSLPADVISSLEKQQNVWVRIITDLGEIELSPQVLKELSTGSSDINISLTYSDDKTLSDDIKDKIAERPIVDITITKGNQNHTDFSGNPIKVAIPYKAKPEEDNNKLLVYFINEKGQSKPLKLSKFDPENNTMKFETTHLSLYAVGYNEVSFNDVKDHWAKANIEFLASREIVKGKSAVRFDPNGNVTRAEFVTMLAYCTDKDIAKSVSAGFVDVATGAWYFDYINWAVKEGIVKGYGNGRFGPNDAITREQMAVMTDNFIKAMKAQLDIVNKKAGFTDQAKINSWSSEAVANMQQYGIIKGKTSGTFDPQGTATRAEAATILKGYIDSLLK